MNYNQRYFNNERDWEKTYSNFPEEWNYEDEETFSSNGYGKNSFGGNGYNNTRYNCYYGQFVICDNQTRPNDTGRRPTKCRCHDDEYQKDCNGNGYDKEDNHDECRRDDNYKKGGRGCGRRNCCFCNLFRNFHC
ncbi:MAG: hypothetical protein J6A28_02965 [Clostridia bacterium]|nr:hypothetical protein [Clostridia bacterium]